MQTAALRRCLAWSARIAGVAVLVAAFGVARDAGTGSPTPDRTRPAASVKPSQGYWLLAADGGVFSYGAATYYGPNRNLGRDIVAMARTPDGAGFWTVDDDGDVFHYGNAAYYGSRPIHPDDIAAFAARPQGDGYWMVTRDGVVWKFGNAPNLSPPTPLRPSKPIVGMAATPSGLGYWLVAIDGGIFSYGDARFYGSTGGTPLNKPIVGMTSTPSGLGYWLVATDGGIFSYGDARFYGSTGGTPLNKPIVGMTSTGTGAGYWMVATDGGIFAFGDAVFYGSTGGVTLNQPIVGMAVTPPIRINTVPAAADDAAGVTEDGSVTVDVLANDAGLTDGGLTVTMVAGPGHGSASVAPDGRIAYAPAANWFGSDSVAYRVADVDGDASTATVGFTVASVNDAPVAADQSLSIAEDLPGTGMVTATDIDSDGMAYVLTGPAAHGTATVNTVNGAGVYTYVPAPNYSGADSFTITVADGQGGVDTAGVHVTVTPVNDNPVVGNQVLATTEDTPVSGFLGATDADSEPLSYTVAGGPAHGTAALNPTSGTFTYTPAANYNGADSLTVTVSDGNGGTATATISITVTPYNDPPTISPIADTVINEDTPTGAISFTVGDTETALTALTVSRESSNLSVVATSGVVVSGPAPSPSVTVTPVANANGSATITLTVSDGAATTSEAFTVTVNPVNDPPVVANQSLTTAEDTPVSRLLAATDVDDPILSYAVTGAASHGSATVDSSSGAFTYTPAANYNGADSFTVTVSDGHGGTDTATISITVTAANDAPTISAVADTVTNEDTATGALPFTIGDTETTASSLTVSGTSSNPSVIPNSGITFGGSGSNRTVTVTPAANASGTATITVTVSDGTAVTTGAFTVTVNAVNDLPTISTIADRSTNEDTSTGAISFTIGDVETPALLLTVSGASSNGALVADSAITFGGSGPNRTVTVTPAPDANGTTVITVTVSDGQDSAGETFTITVNAVNDAPVISPIADTSTNEDTATGAIGFTISDVEIPATSLTLSGSSSNQTVVPNSEIIFGGSGGSRTITVTPAPNVSGTATITVAVSDGTGTSSEPFVLTVNAVNDLPTISAIADVSIPLGTSTGLLTFTVGDVETAPPNLPVTAASSDPAVVPNDDLNLLLGGSGPDRTLVVTPDPLAVGSTTITVTVSDGTTSTQTSFLLTVTA